MMDFLSVFISSRTADRLARLCAFNDLLIADYEDTANHHVPNAFGV